MEATGYVCTGCGRSARKWFGRCPECGAWANAVEERPRGAVDLEVRLLSAIDGACRRLATGLPELDRVLGGGLVPGSVVLMAGQPGAGKSTLALQLLEGVGRKAASLLVTGEESLEQTALRAARLGVDVGGLRVAASSSLPQTLETCRRERSELLVVDSIQTLADPRFEQAPGSVVQARECAAELVRFAKATGTTVLLIGHVTKDGNVAGPKVLEHVVDVILTLEGERTGSIRLLRSVKNRFGSCDETGVWTMGERGLTGVADPSAMLLADRSPGVAGSIVFPALEGSRPTLVELQALVTDSALSQPRRVSIGLDGGRLALLLGVLHKSKKLSLRERDVFVAAVGGLAVREPGSDLALALALASASLDRALDERVVALGEVGLGGEVRRVPGIERRLAEAARFGFSHAIVPRGRWKAPRVLEIHSVTRLDEAFAAARALQFCA